jgi:hypothetical protein
MQHQIQMMTSPLRDYALKGQSLSGEQTVLNSAVLRSLPTNFLEQHVIHGTHHDLRVVLVVVHLLHSLLVYLLLPPHLMVVEAFVDLQQRLDSLA